MQNGSTDFFEKNIYYRFNSDLNLKKVIHRFVSEILLIKNVFLELGHTDFKQI